MSDSLSWKRIHAIRNNYLMNQINANIKTSFAAIQLTKVKKTAQIIDIGGGNSTLADDLLNEGYSKLSILDNDQQSLEASQQRLKNHANKIHWIATDIMRADLANTHFDIWHDAAVFHRFTRVEDRLDYLKKMHVAVKLSGHVIIAVLADETSEKHSLHYSTELLQAQLGSDYVLHHELYEIRMMPLGTVAKFAYCHFRKLR